MKIDKILKSLPILSLIFHYDALDHYLGLCGDEECIYHAEERLK